MCVSLYIHNKYTQYTHIYHVNQNVILDAINRLDSTNIYINSTSSILSTFQNYKKIKLGNVGGYCCNKYGSLQG